MERCAGNTGGRGLDEGKRGERREISAPTNVLYEKSAPMIGSSSISRGSGSGSGSGLALA